MKTFFSKTLLGSAALLASGAGQAAPVLEALVHAEDAVETVNACLVGTANSAAISACLCGASNADFDFCASDGGGFVVHPVFSAAWAASLTAAETALSAEMLPITIPLSNPAGTRWVVDARGNCSLVQGSLELAFSQESDKTKLKGLLGAKASYSAVYMVPYIYDSILGEPVPAGDPVRLCSLGQAAINAGLVYKPKHGKVLKVDEEEAMAGDTYKARHDYHKQKRAKRILDLALQGIEIGVTGGMKWAVPGDAPYVYSSGVYPTIGVRYVLVSAVGAALAQAGYGKSVNAIGVLANTKLTDRVLHVERKAAALFAVTDDDQGP